MKLKEEGEKVKEKKREQNKGIEEILNRIEEDNEDEDVDEEDVKIFSYYKGGAEDKEQIVLDEEEELKRLKRQHYDPSKFEKPIQKMRKGNDQETIRNATAAETFREEDEVDLTGHLK